MMKTFQHIINIVLAFTILSLSACSNEGYWGPEEGKSVSVTFRPKLGEDLNTRAIGDATGIDQLKVLVYEGSTTLTGIFETTTEWSDAQTNGIALTLIEGHSYQILFWAENKDNTAYSITQDGKIEVNYDHYYNGGFAKMEELDVFYGVSHVTVGTQKNETKSVELSRPLAQLNFADNTTKPEQGTHKAIVTFHRIPTSLNPFTGEIEMSNSDYTFSFTDFPTENLKVEGADYYYISSNYLLAPTSTNSTTDVELTLDLQNADGTSIKTIEFIGEDKITIERNKKTNVLGTIVQQPITWSVWDGTTYTPASAVELNDENEYIIDEAADLAWLTQNGKTISAGTFRQTVDIDMAGHDIPSIKLPAGSTYDGDNKQIKNYRNTLFGDAISLSVKNLTVDGVIASPTENHVGVLINTLSGSASFENVTVLNSSANTNNGAAGGMIGYIVRQSANNRSEVLNVIFDNCHVNETSIEGSRSEGHFVGLLRGYDRGEKLQFKNNCTLTLSATATQADDFVSPYTEGNEGAWLADNNYTKFNGWLGNEECYRGIVMYGDYQFIPRWDGKTTIEPLLVNGSAAEEHKYEVYSAFDLAGVRNATVSPAALYLMENVDMFGQGSDGEYFVHSNFTKSAFNSTDDNKFNAFSSIALLEGNNKGIYNLALNANGSDRYAFILSGNNGDIHRNTSFHNCCTVVPHVVKDNEDKSYGATVVLSISGATYTMENVHAYGCKVFALQKTGIIAGRVTSLTMATIKDCTVNNCYIENYDCKDHAEQFGSGKISTTFYTPGEVGGFIGFVENFATISNCHVKGTTIYAFGQDNKRLLIFYTVYGRHVGQFIGDIRTSDNEKDKIILTNCSVDSNTKCTKRWDKHGKCNMIGCVYSLPLLDSKGTVTLNGKSIF